MSTEGVEKFLNKPVSELFSVEEGKLDEEVDPGQVEGTDLRIVKYPHPSLREVRRHTRMVGGMGAGCV